jgi:hypothetical protein
MATKRVNRSVVVLGLITVAMYLAAIVLLPRGAPDSASTGEQITTYASAHRGQLLASYLTFAMGLALLLVFAAGLHRIIRRVEPEDGWLAMASVASAAGGAGIFGAGIASFMVVAYRPAADPGVVRAFWDAGWLALNVAGFGFVMWIAVITLATLRHDALPRWSVWVAIPVGVINLIGPFAVQTGNGALSPQGWYATVVGLTFALWLLVVAVAAGRPTRTGFAARRAPTVPRPHAVDLHLE